MLQVGYERKNRSARHGNSRAQRVILERYEKLRVRKKKGLIKHEDTEDTRHVRHEARGAREHAGHEARKAQENARHEARETREHVGIEARTLRS